MADDDAVGLDVGDRWQLALVERREEIDRILDVGGALRRIAHIDLVYENVSQMSQ